MKLTPENLREKFIGTTSYWGNSSKMQIAFTDGVKYFLDKTSAHWLLDFAKIACSLDYDYHLVFIEIIVKHDSKAAQVIISDGDRGDGPVIFVEATMYNVKIPEGNWQFIVNTAQNVFYLISEH